MERRCSTPPREAQKSSSAPAQHAVAIPTPATTEGAMNTATNESLFYILKVVVVLIAWFGIGTVLIFSNKILLTSGLHAPISLTTLHMCASFIFATGMVNLGGFKAQFCKSNGQRMKVAILATAFGVSVVSSVASFGFIPVSFYEMISSTTPMFTAAFAFLVVGERGGTLIGYTALLCIAVGASIATHGEPMWNAVGFSLAALSTVLRAFKAVLQQALLQSEDEKLDSINLLRHISFCVILLLAPFAALMEGPTSLIDSIVRARQLDAHSQLEWYLLLNVSAAFLVNWIQMQVTKMIGATLLQVLGIFKGSATAILSLVFFQNPVTAKSVLGYVMVVVAVVVYNVNRNQEWAKSLLARCMGYERAPPLDFRQEEAGGAGAAPARENPSGECLQDQGGPGRRPSDDDLSKSKADERA